MRVCACRILEKLVTIKSFKILHGLNVKEWKKEKGRMQKGTAV